MLKQQRGVTLIELIAGIVVLAISLSIITSVLGPLYIKSADPWHQVRAAELGQSLMNEILARSFDENSNRSGGLLRCDEDGAEKCSCTTPEILLGLEPCIGTAGIDYLVFGPNGESREYFNDVDDFHNFSATGDQITNILNEQLIAIYRQYQLNVTVLYAGADAGLDNRQAKKITISVTTPTGTVIDFAAYKGNW